jgi:hypothetical protein
MNRSASLALVIIALSVSGCSAFNKLTKKTDNTVLPGQREEILAPDQYKVEDATVNGKQQPVEDAPQKACDPQVDANCSDAIDQEAGSDG